MFLTFGGALVLAFEVVVSVMCWAGAVPAMLGRSLGVWLGSLVLHCALLPLLNAALLALGFATGAGHRTAELGLLALRAFQPTARCCCCAAQGPAGLPRHVLPELPPGFPPASPPAHRYQEGPPPPWWRSEGQGSRAYQEGVEACCLKPCAYDAKGAFTYPCCPKQVGRGMTLCAWGGVYLLIACLQNGLALLLVIPLAAALAAFLASLLYIPAGCASVLVSCFLWEGHLYTVLPRLAERTGVVLGERAVDLVALAITSAVLAPVYCVGLLFTRRASLSSWALTWASTLRSGAAVPAAPAAGDKSLQGAVLQQQNPLLVAGAQGIELPPLRPGQSISIVTGSGRNILIHQVSTLYAPLGIAHYSSSSGPGTSIWNAGGGWYPPPPAPPSSTPAPFMRMPRVPSWRGSSMSAAALVGSTPQSSSILTGAAMPPNPMAAALGGGGFVPPPLPPSAGACAGCGASLLGCAGVDYYDTVCSGGCRACRACYAVNLLTYEACNLSDGKLPYVSSWEALLQCPWGGGGAGACTLTAQGPPGSAQSICTDTASPHCLKRLHSALALRDAAGNGAAAAASEKKSQLSTPGCMFKPCTRKPQCAGVVYARLAEAGVEALPVWSVCVVCGESEAVVAPVAVEAPVAAAPVPVPAAAAALAAIPQWPSFLFSVGELPFSLPLRLLRLVSALPQELGDV